MTPSTTVSVSETFPSLATTVGGPGDGTTVSISENPPSVGSTVGGPCDGTTVSVSETPPTVGTTVGGYGDGDRTWSHGEVGEFAMMYVCTYVRRIMSYNVMQCN